MRLQRLFSDILVDNVWMVTVTNRDPDGRISTVKYYTTSRPVEKNAFVQFMSLISFNGKEQFRLIDESSHHQARKDRVKRYIERRIVEGPEDIEN